MKYIDKNTKTKKSQKNSTKVSTTESRPWAKDLGKIVLDTLNAQK